MDIFGEGSTSFTKHCKNKLRNLPDLDRPFFNCDDFPSKTSKPFTIATRIIRERIMSMRQEGRRAQ